MSITEQLSSEAKRLAQILEEQNRKIVFAESCTGGLVSATLTQIPGISSYHCGSAVTNSGLFCFTLPTEARL